MKHKTSQAGFTLIELIAVMVILGILAAVIIPRISTLTSGAYESNVRSMYGVIRNEVNAQAVKKAMTGGAAGHREEYPQISSGTANNYLKEWVEDFDGNLWAQEQTVANAALGYVNADDLDGDDEALSAAVFYYMPHGIDALRTNAQTGDAGTSTNKTDIYFIFYAPHTTEASRDLGRNYDGFTLRAYRNTALDLTWDGVGTEELITDLNWTTPNNP